MKQKKRPVNSDRPLCLVLLGLLGRTSSGVSDGHHAVGIVQAYGDGTHRDVLKQFARQCLVLIGAIVGFTVEPFFTFLFHHRFAPLISSSASGSQLYGLQFDFQGLRAALLDWHQCCKWHRCLGLPHCHSYLTNSWIGTDANCFGLRRFRFGRKSVCRQRGHGQC